MPFLFKKRGFTLVEVLVAASIISLSIYGVLMAASNFLKTSRSAGRSIQAAFLLSEGAEALRVIRDRSWTNEVVPLDSNTTYYLEWSGGTWRPTVTPVLIDNLFTRSFAVSPVYRDLNDDIAASGTIDPDTKKFDVTVAWKLPNRATSTRSAALYLTNFFNE